MADGSRPPLHGLWSTAAFGLPAAPSAREVSALGEHLAACRHGGRLAALHCGAQGLRRFLATHLVTSAAVVVLVLAAGWIAW